MTGISFLERKREMNQDIITKLQFDQIIAEVQKRALGEYSRKKIGHLKVSSHLTTVKDRQQETQEARLIIDSGQHVPFMGLTQIQRLLQEIQKGQLLMPRELIEVADFLRSHRLIRNFFEKNQYQTPLLYAYSKNLVDFLEIERAIYEKVQGQQLADDASKNLRKVRKQLREIEKEIEAKLLKFIRHPQNKSLIQEALIVKKGEYFTIPIKASYKTKVSGTIIVQSGKGQTVFIEPSGVAKLNQQMVLLKAQEVAEEYQILAELSGLVSEQEAAILHGLETITTFDIIFARGKYSRELNGITPSVNKEERITIKKGRHPFLPQDAVPLDFNLGRTYRGLVITGANAGGKTLVLKTVGLLTLMTMFGLQIPAAVGTDIAVVDQLFVDIGDQQNLENALSTFSGHMRNISEILSKIKRHTIVLFDEIGSGTEPNEGAALAIAIMEACYQKGALIVATTHYGEIKRFAQVHEDFVPAAMTFDPDTLAPRFHLQVGEVGESQALWLAKKMALPDSVLQQAANYIQEKAYTTAKVAFKKVESVPNTPSLLTLADRYHKGDRVHVTATKENALVFADQGGATVQVFIKGDIKEVLRKRLSLTTAAVDLYPENYDLDSLFIDFQTRKEKHDIERGSKKAQRRLKQAAKKRAQQLNNQESQQD